MQLALTENAGIGIRGVNYFLLNYIHGRFFKDASFKMEFRGALMLVGLALTTLFLFTNSMSWTNFGIRSMIVVLIFGSITGFLAGFQNKIASYTFCLPLTNWDHYHPALFALVSRMKPIQGEVLLYPNSFN